MEPPRRRPTSFLLRAAASIGIAYAGGAVAVFGLQLYWRMEMFMRPDYAGCAYNALTWPLPFIRAYRNHLVEAKRAEQAERQRWGAQK